MHQWVNVNFCCYVSVSLALFFSYGNPMKTWCPGWRRGGGGRRFQIFQWGCDLEGHRIGEGQRLGSGGCLEVRLVQKGGRGKPV